MLARLLGQNICLTENDNEVFGAGGNDRIICRERGLTDAQLLAQAQDGESSAWQELYHRLLPSAWREACARVSDREVAEEIVAETFLALVRNLHTLDPEECKLHGWIRQVVRNKISDWARRKNSQTRALEGARHNPPGRCSETPVEELLAIEKRALIVNVLGMLRDDQRTVLELKYAEGLAVRDIAERLDQTEKAIESLLYRARVDFRRKYDVHSKQSDRGTIDLRTLQP